MLRLVQFLFYRFIFSGISSLTFSKYGEAVYFHSSSELQRISVSATKVNIYLIYV